MNTLINFRTTLAIAAVALSVAACGSVEPEVAGSENVETADAGPAAGFQRTTFNFIPEEVIDDVYRGDLTTFEVRSASGDETIVIGFLDDTGTIDIPNEVARGTIGVEAELPDDKFCWWSGFHTTSNPASEITVEVELEEVCA